MKNIVTKDFVCIVGAQRSGTTYLFHLLNEHPEIEMAKPVKPEPKFFLNDADFDRGLDFYLNKHFKDLKIGTKTIGEKGTSYLEYPYVANRIQSFFRFAKIVITIRNPVDRALSNYFFSVENGLETRTIEEVFIRKLRAPQVGIKTSVSPFDYLQRGHYHELIVPYMNIFKDNLKVIVFEEAVGNLEAIQSLYKFIGVNSEFKPPSLSKIINESKSNVIKDELIEVVAELKSYYRPHIRSLERILERKIEIWHD